MRDRRSLACLVVPRSLHGHRWLILKSGQSSLLTAFGKHRLCLKKANRTRQQLNLRCCIELSLSLSRSSSCLPHLSAASPEPPGAGYQLAHSVSSALILPIRPLRRRTYLTSFVSPHPRFTSLHSCSVAEHYTHSCSTTINITTPRSSSSTKAKRTSRTPTQEGRKEAFISLVESESRTVCLSI